MQATPVQQDASRRHKSPRPNRKQLTRAGVIAVLLLFVLFGLPQLLSLYYIDTMTQVAVYSMVALGLGVLVGRVGLVSLGQVAVLAIGAWVAARLLFATTQPYPLVLLEAGLITMVLGVIIGLPALRLRGLYLALITLMLAGAITVVLATVNFPNGGHGFLGYNGSLVHIPPIRRPSIAASDPAYFRYSVVVAILMFALVLAHIKTRPGRAWAAIRQSEPAALAAGINTWLYKLWAFALASFITGVAGGVLAGAVHYLYSIGFPTQDSITLLAVVLMGGAYSLWGAVVAALLYQFLPALLNNWGVSADWLTILFGIGVLQVLTTAPAGLADQVPKDLARLGRLLRGRIRKAAARAGGVTRHDRGRRPDRPLRRRHLAGRHEPDVRAGYLRAHRAERGRQDHLLQRAERLRPARRGNRARVRGRPALDGPFPPRPLGGAPDVPDRTGHRGALGVRQRGDGARALQARRRLPPRRRAGRDRVQPASTPPRRRRCARSGSASAAWSRSPARSSGGHAWSCSTSPPPGCRTRRPATWPRSSAASPSIPARWPSWSTTT